jgi:hypothetical protein
MQVGPEGAYFLLIHNSIIHYFEQSVQRWPPCAAGVGCLDSVHSIVSLQDTP